jgi:hypothetical protein
MAKKKKNVHNTDDWKTILDIQYIYYIVKLVYIIKYVFLSINVAVTPKNHDAYEETKAIHFFFLKTIDSHG